MPLEDIPKLGEIVSLPGSSKKHEVCEVHRKLGARRQGGTYLLGVVVTLRKPEKN